MRIVQPRPSGVSAQPAQSPSRLSWRRRGVRGALLAIALLAALPAISVAQTAATPNLTGEQAFGNGTFQAQPDSTCKANGTGTLHYIGTGNATGPFPGTFTEEGTLKFGPRATPSGLNSITKFKATFDITSTAGHVVGSTTLGDAVPPQLGTFDFTNMGECRQVNGFGINYFQVATNYQATITVGTTATPDCGKGHMSGATARTISPSNYTEEEFQSNCPVPTSREDCKAGGYKQYGFTSKSDCAAYIKARGKNSPTTGG